jgi:mRNA interferase MazF
MTVKRYEIWTASLDPTVGGEIRKTRPVLVVSPDAMNTHLETVVICPLTTKLHPGWKSRIPVESAGTTAEVAVDQIRTISKTRLRIWIDRITDQAASLIRETIVSLYGTG